MISTLLLFYLGLYIGVPVWYHIMQESREGKQI